MKTAKRPSMLAMSCCLLFLVTTTVNKYSSSAAAARSLGNSTPKHAHSNHNNKVTFLMRNVLNMTHNPSSETKPSTTKVTSTQLPFSKPIGLFPPNGAIPLPQTKPTAQTLDLSGIGLFFPARATLEELEFRIVNLIDEDIFESSSGYFGSRVIGKAQGIYVASSEDGSSHMMAMTAHFFNGEFKGGLRLFGVHGKSGDAHEHGDESHVAVIGGIGKFVGANGYATVKVVNNNRNNNSGSNNIAAGEEGGNKLLRLNVYLS